MSFVGFTDEHYCPDFNQAQDAAPDARSTRIAELRRAIQTQRYFIPAAVVANALMRHMLDR